MKLPLKKKILLQRVVAYAERMSAETRVQRVSAEMLKQVALLGGKRVLESTLRRIMSNTPDVSKGLRELCSGGELLRTGSGGRLSPFMYSVNTVLYVV